MTRQYIYGGALVASAAATAMTIASNSMVRWIRFDITAYNTRKHVWKTIGLHEQCASEWDACRPFPEPENCAGEERFFCSMWRTTGFVMSVAAVLELVTLVGFLVVMAGGRMKREVGWKIIAALLVLVMALQFVGMSFVSYLFDYDDQFSIPGYHLDSSWFLCTASAILSLLIALGLIISHYMLPPEAGYEFLNDPVPE